MAKKTITKDLKNILGEFIEKSIEALAFSIGRINPMNVLNNLTHMKAKMRTYFAVQILTVSGLTLFLIGLSMYLRSVWTVLANGAGEMIIGVVVLLISLIVYLIRR